MVEPIAKTVVPLEPIPLLVEAVVAGNQQQELQEAVVLAVQALFMFVFVTTHKEKLCRSISLN